MDKTQKVALLLFIGGTLIGVLIIVISGGVLQPLKSSSFRAAPGRQLEAARPLFASTDAEDAPPAEAPDPQEAGPPPLALPAAVPEPQPVARTPEPAELSPVDRAIAQARAALEPETGVHRIEALLLSLASLADASRLYTAKAGLHLRMEPPDYESADAAVSQALEYARDADERDDAGCVRIEMMRRAGRVDEALATAEQISSGDGPETPGKFRAAMLQAAIQREQGDAQSAEKTYRAIMARAVRAADHVGAQAKDIYRQAGLNLVQLLREEGRRDRADADAHEIELELERFRGDAGS